MKRGQISVEYIMIIAVSLMILLPGIYVFRNYAFESNDQLIEKRLSEVSSFMLGKARKVYYYGPPSRSVINIEMPPQIDKMYILKFIDPDPSKNEYHLGFSILSSQGRKEYTFLSDIHTSELSDCVDIAQDCSYPKICQCFSDKYYSKGLRYFDLEAAEACEGTMNCVKIGLFTGD
jgi:hypothetical protein